MSRLIRVTAPKGKIGKLRKAIESDGCRVLTVSAVHDGKRTISVVAGPERRQDLFDRIQGCFGASDDWLMVVQPVEAVVPRDSGDNGDAPRGRTREELYDEVVGGAAFDLPTLSLIAISAVVAAVGMVGDSVAVVIGAMVIAPLLGPILAVILGTALGERDVILRALRVLAVGCLIAVAIGVAAGVLFDYDPDAGQIVQRSSAGLENVALALASGAAAALSLTTGVPAVLVGVMVAAALLPPATAIGLFLGKGLLYFASGAALLLLINVSAVTLAGQIVFLVQGVRPRSWYKKKKATQSVLVSIVFWSAALLLLVALSYLKSWSAWAP
ncbi:MAG: TIGR00341 family protein [Pseudomonadota bacterium]|nr:TIGR00341 family protein [Pseudomonadota bacterium]